jgi:hypothetical protein
VSLDGYDNASHHRSVPSLGPDDSRVGWLTVRDSRAFSAACDRWLEKRGVRTRSVWWDSQLQNRKKK